MNVSTRKNEGGDKYGKLSNSVRSRRSDRHDGERYRLPDHLGNWQRPTHRAWSRWSYDRYPVRNQGLQEIHQVRKLITCVLVAVLAFISFVGAAGAASASVPAAYADWQQRQSYEETQGPDKGRDEIDTSLKRFTQATNLKMLSIPVSDLRFDGRTVAWRLDDKYIKDPTHPLCNVEGYNKYYKWRVFFQDNHPSSTDPAFGETLGEAEGRYSNHIVLDDSQVVQLNERMASWPEGVGPLGLVLECYNTTSLRGAEPLTTNMIGIDQPYKNTALVSGEHTDMGNPGDPSPDDPRPNGPPPIQPVREGGGSTPSPSVPSDPEPALTPSPTPVPSDPVPPVEGGETDGSEEGNGDHDDSGDDGSGSEIECVIWKPATWTFGCLGGFLMDLIIPKMSLSDHWTPIKDALSQAFPFSMVVGIGDALKGVTLADTETRIAFTFPQLCVPPQQCENPKEFVVYDRDNVGGEIVQRFRPIVSGLLVFSVYFAVISNWYQRRSSKGVTD